MANGIFDGKSYTQLTRLNITEDLRVRGNVGLSWGGAWQPVGYGAGTMVQQNGWLMVANKDTQDNAAPLPNGNPSFTLGDTPPFATTSNTSVVYSGQRYSFNRGGWLKSLRVWVPSVGGTIEYSFFVLIFSPLTGNETLILDSPELIPGQWNIISLGNKIIIPGTDVYFLINALNSGATTDFQHEWTYQGESNNLPPTNGGCNRNVQYDIIRINKTDNEGNDRTAELNSVIANTVIRYQSTENLDRFWEFRVNEIIENINNYVFGVSYLGEGPSGGLNSGENTLVSFEVPIPLATEYVEILNHWPANQPEFATVIGWISYDDFNVPDQTKFDNAYGVDVEFQPATVSEDWDFAAYTEF